MSGSGERMDTETVTTPETTETQTDAVVAVNAPPRTSHADDAGEVVFDIGDLSVFYGAYRAVRDVSLMVRQNEITALIGPSGCGKTTVLRCLNRMNDLVEGARIEGRVNYHGVNLYDDAVDAVEVRRRIGMVFQKPNPFRKSIYYNISFGPKIPGMKVNMD